MDFSNSETPPSDILMRYYSNNAPFYSTYRPQAFPFRDTLICYITNNPASSKLYQKMIQSCKYFFIKNPIIIVRKLCYNQREGWYIQKSHPSNDHPNGRSIYLNKLTSKMWITDSLDVGGNTQNWPVVTPFRQKIYQCDATSMYVYDHMFTFNDLMFIASKCEFLYLKRVVIMNNDETVPETKHCFETDFPLEAIFNALPNVKTFRYFLPNNPFNIITTKTAEELLKIPHFLSLEKFGIIEIPDTFDITSFYGYIKKNKKTKIFLDFSDQISDEYKTRLQIIVDEILETGNRDYKVPRIFFIGITNSSREKMRTLYRQN